MAGRGSGLFTATFGNLRQFLMEHQLQQPQHQAGWLRLAPATEGPVETGDRTKQLFEVRAGMPQLSKNLPLMQEKAPLTILYQGQVRVFDDVPVDKVVRLMQLAGAWLASKAPPESGSSAGSGLQLKRAADVPLEDLLDMPARRMASVQRHLHKREYRAPGDYPDQRITGKNEPADLKAMNDVPPASWLKL